MWSARVSEVILIKGDRGLGFSILDYQDPGKPSESVIVIRRVIRGGVASLSKRLLPGDRLVYVNDTRLDKASLDVAVHALKGAPYGPVRLGIAKGMTKVTGAASADVATAGGNSCKEIHQSPIVVSDVLDSSGDAEEGDDACDQTVDSVICACNNTSSSTDTANDNATTFKIVPSELSKVDKGDDVFVCLPERRKRDLLEPAPHVPILPHLPKFTVVVNKAAHQSLGLHLEALAFDLCGTLVRALDPTGAAALDGRIRPRDLVIYLNHESLWRVTSSQAKAVLRRADFITTGIPIVLIPEESLFENQLCPSPACSSSSTTTAAATVPVSVSTRTRTLSIAEEVSASMDSPSTSSSSGDEKSPAATSAFKESPLS